MGDLAQEVGRYRSCDKVLTVPLDVSRQVRGVVRSMLMVAKERAKAHLNQ